MALWKLLPDHGSLWWCVDGKDPWQPHWGKAFGFVVRAPSEEEARWQAHASGGEENRTLPGVQPWLDPHYSRCDPLSDDGAAEVLLVNFREGR